MKLRFFYKLGLLVSLLPLLGSLACSPATQRSRAQAANASKKSSPMPSSIQGNSALHYIDSRLHKLYQRDEAALQALKKATSHDADSSYLHAELARHFAEAGQFEQATFESDQAIKIAPNLAENHLLRGKLYSVKKMSDSAMKEYETCIRKDPDYEECYTMMTREYILKEDYPLARKTIQRLLKRDPNSVEGLFFLGTLDQKEGRLDQAIKNYRRALDEDPDYYKAILSLAHLYLNQKKYPEALDYFLELERLNPEDMATQLRIGLLYYEMEKIDEAVQRFTKILKYSPKNDRVYYYLGILEAQNKNYQRAIKYFQEVGAFSGFYKDAVIRHILVLREMDRLSEATQVIQTALKKRKDIPEFYELLSNLYLREEKNQKAMAILDQGIERFPNDEKLLFSKGVLLDQQGSYDKSMEIMNQILKINPDNALALNYVGYTYADRGIRLPEALAMLQKADQLKPDDGYITDSLAWAYFKTGDTQKALELLEKANRIAPNEPTILEHLGDVHLKLGQKDRAKHFFQEAVAAAVKDQPQDNRDKEDLERIQAKLTSLGNPALTP